MKLSSLFCTSSLFPNFHRNELFNHPHIYTLHSPQKDLPLKQRTVINMTNITKMMNTTESTTAMAMISPVESPEDAGGEVVPNNSNTA